MAICPELSDYSGLNHRSHYLDKIKNLSLFPEEYVHLRFLTAQSDGLFLKQLIKADLLISYSQRLFEFSSIFALRKLRPRSWVPFRLTLIWICWKTIRGSFGSQLHRTYGVNACFWIQICRHISCSLKVQILILFVLSWKENFDQKTWYLTVPADK